VLIVEGPLRGESLRVGEAGAAVCVVGELRRPQTWGSNQSVVLEPKIVVDRFDRNYLVVPNLRPDHRLQELQVGAV